MEDRDDWVVLDEDLEKGAGAAETQANPTESSDPGQSALQEAEPTNRGIDASDIVLSCLLIAVRFKCSAVSWT